VGNLASRTVNDVPTLPARCQACWKLLIAASDTVRTRPVRNTNGRIFDETLPVEGALTHSISTRPLMASPKCLSFHRLKLAGQVVLLTRASIILVSRRQGALDETRVSVLQRSRRCGIPGRCQVPMKAEGIDSELAKSRFQWLDLLIANAGAPPTLDKCIGA
jgi:hypothetical protein